LWKGLTLFNGQKKRKENDEKSKPKPSKKDAISWKSERKREFFIAGKKGEEGWPRSPKRVAGHQSSKKKNAAPP